jgi:hypothetical protein
VFSKSERWKSHAEEREAYIHAFLRLDAEAIQLERIDGINAAATYVEAHLKPLIERVFQFSACDYHFILPSSPEKNLRLLIYNIDKK